MDSVVLGLKLVSVGWLVMAAVGVAVLGVILWILRARVRDAMTFLVVALLAIPIGIKLIQERTVFSSQASDQIKVVDTRAYRTEQGDVVVYVTFSQPAFAILQYQDEANRTESVLPVGKVQPRTGHTFELSGLKAVSGAMKVVVNGMSVGEVQIGLDEDGL